MPWPAIPFIDFDYSQASPQGLPEFEAPIPGVATEYVLTQKFRKSRNQYDIDGPLTLNSPHYFYNGAGGLPLFQLVEEGPRRDITGGIVEFQRKYALVPATHYEWEKYSYSFIGTVIFVGPPTAQTVVTTPRRQRRVRCRVQYDYCIIPTPNFNDPITQTAYNVNSPADFAQIYEQIYCYQNTIAGITYGGLTMQSDVIFPAGFVTPTWPSSDQYQTMVQDAITNGFNGATLSKVVLFPSNTIGGSGAQHMAGVVDTGNSVLGGLIVVEPGIPERWMGNIFQRVTRYVLAQ